MENSITNIPASPQTQMREVYKVKNERMGGFVTSWDKPKPSNETIDFKGAMNSYARVNEQDISNSVHIDTEDTSSEFGFEDLVDMVNPLHHVPVVNFAYRELSGDEIKPVSQIIGGGIFGGPAGLASSLVNVIVKEETGKDVMDNAVSFAGYNSRQQTNNANIDIIDEYIAYEDLPVSLLAFAQKPIAMSDTEGEKLTQKNNEYERVQIASGRSAGTIAVYT